MPTWSEVKRWKGSRLDGFIDTVISRKLTANDVVDEISAISMDTWQGEGAVAAEQTRSSLLERAEKVYDNFQYLLTATSTAQDGLGEVETLVLEAQSRADHYGFVISEDGSEVTDPQLDQWWERLGANIAAGQSSAYAAELADRQAALQDCADAVSTALSRANKVDQAYCDALANISGDLVTSDMATGSGTFPGLPDNPSTEQTAAWWDSLTEEEQLDYIKSHPELIGGMDGVDGWARDQANRHLLDRDIALAEEQIAAGNGTPELEDELAEMQALQDSLESADGEVRQLLLYEPATGEDGNYHMHAAVSVGDIDTADHISTFVPGMTTNVRDSIGPYTSDLHNLNAIAQGKLDAMGSDETVASIAWLGYDAPGGMESIVQVDSMDDVKPGDFPLILPQGEYQDPAIFSVDASVITPERAEQGGQNLTNFVEGIHDSRVYDSEGSNDPHTSVLGHSYGSTTSSYGVADARPGTVDDYIAFGTPGVDGGSWNMNAGNNYVMNYDNEELIRYLNNPIQWVTGIQDAGGLGTDPSQDPGFTTLDPGPADPGLAHTQYLNDQSQAQEHLSDVVIGEAP